MIFVIIIGGVYNIVSNYESNINVPSNETIGSIANKTVVNLLRWNLIKEVKKGLF